MTVAGKSYTLAGGTANGTVSIGSASKKRTITNVAAGTVSATSTDAVNGSQLHAVVQAVESTATVASSALTKATDAETKATAAVSTANSTAAGYNAAKAEISSSLSSQKPQLLRG